MKDLKQLLLEKLIINKDIVKSPKSIENLDIPWRFKAQFNALSNKEKSTIYKNIENQFTKHSSIKRLCNTNTHLYTIFNKWFCAILLQWDEAFIELKNVIVDSNYIPNIESLLDAFIFKIYNNDEDSKLLVKEYLSKYDNNKLKESLENYFKIYNISY